MGKDKVKVDEKLVAHIAQLAKLKVSSGEISQYVKYMQQVLGYVEQLNEVKTKDVEPMYGPVMEEGQQFENVLKSSFAYHVDKSQAFEDHQAILSNAPQQEDGHYKIKAIIEEQ